MTNNLPVSDMQRFAENYRYISRMDFNSMPARLAREGLALKSGMDRAMARMSRSAYITDAANGLAQKQGVGAIPLIPIFGASALTWLATKWADRGDEYVAKASVIEQLIASGVSPQRAADIVLGKEKWPTWQIVLYTAAGTALTIGGVTLWRGRRKR